MDDSDPVDFTPVPLRARRDGWTPERQRAFIAALARCGSVSAAARQVGKAVRGAYRLLDRPGAGSFAEAWDLAAEMGRDATRDCVIDRAMHGAWVPVVRRGRIVRLEFRTFDKLAIAVLSGRDRHLAEARRAGPGPRAERAADAARRQELKAEDARRAAIARENEDLWQAAGHRLAEKARAPRATTPPRIRRL